MDPLSVAHHNSQIFMNYSSRQEPHELEEFKCFFVFLPQLIDRDIQTRFQALSAIIIFQSIEVIHDEIVKQFFQCLILKHRSSK